MKKILFLLAALIFGNAKDTLSQTLWMYTEDGYALKDWGAKPNWIITWNGTHTDGKINGSGELLIYVDGVAHIRYQGNYYKGMRNGFGVMEWLEEKKSWMADFTTTS